MKAQLLSIATILLLSPVPETNGFSSTSSRSSIIRSLTTTATTATPFQSTTVSSRRQQCIIHLSSHSYGRGAEIWPECNEDPVQLADSFPNGQVPYSAILSSIDETDMTAIHQRVQDVVEQREEKQTNNNHNKRGRRSKRKIMSKTIGRILRRAAAKEELESETGAAATTARMKKTPMMIALGLLVRGLVQPFDALLVSFVTGYFILLNLVAQSTRENTEAPILPAIPPQGHVPAMVSNPLGTGFMYSKVYNVWLQLGLVTGLIGPLVLLARYMYVPGVHGVVQDYNNMVAARLCASPLFLLSCQAMSEAISRRVMAPLPLRILIPIAYNTARLGYLWNWALHPEPIGLPGRILAIANAFYWASNLFCFLLPIATIRYMRAHFFGVEAEEVTTRVGMEESVGLIPHQ